VGAPGTGGGGCGGVGAGCWGRGGRWGGIPAVPSHTVFHGIGRRGVGGRGTIFFCFLGTGRRGGQSGSCGLLTANGLYALLPMIYQGRMRVTNKRKKITPVISWSGLRRLPILVLPEGAAPIFKENQFTGNPSHNDTTGLQHLLAWPDQPALVKSLGLCPGRPHKTSRYDAHRCWRGTWIGETYGVLPHGFLLRGFRRRGVCAVVAEKKCVSTSFYALTNTCSFVNCSLHPCSCSTLLPPASSGPIVLQLCLHQKKKYICAHCARVHFINKKKYLTDTSAASGRTRLRTHTSRVLAFRTQWRHPG